MYYVRFCLLFTLWFLVRLRCVGFLATAVQRAGLLMLLIFVLTVMTFVASGSCAGNCDYFVRLMFQPCFSVHYRASPPIWSQHSKPFINMLTVSAGLRGFFLGFFFSKNESMFLLADYQAECCTLNRYKLKHNTKKVKYFVALLGISVVPG